MIPCLNATSHVKTLGISTKKSTWHLQSNTTLLSKSGTFARWIFLNAAYSGARMVYTLTEKKSPHGRTQWSRRKDFLVIIHLAYTTISGEWILTTSWPKNAITVSSGRSYPHSPSCCLLLGRLHPGRPGIGIGTPQAGVHCPGSRQAGAYCWVQKTWSASTKNMKFASPKCSTRKVRDRKLVKNSEISKRDWYILLTWMVDFYCIFCR